MSLSTFEQASTAIARLDLAFGGEDVTEDQRFREMRLFRNARAEHVEVVVGRVVRYFVRRPNIDELRQLLAEEHLGRLVDDEDVTPACDVVNRVDELRQQVRQ